MQYSSDGKKWPVMRVFFDADAIAKSLSIKPGDWIYYRESEGDVVRKMQWGKKYGR